MHKLQCKTCGQTLKTRFIKDDESKTSKLIVDTILAYFDVDMAFLLRKERSMQRVYARQVMYYFLRDRTLLTMDNIAMMFNQDRSTITHSLQKFADLVSIYEPIQRDVKEINKILTIAEQPIISD